VKPRKTLEKILYGSKNIRFADMTALVRAFGFHLSRTSGSHHIFTHPQIPELVNLQEVMVSRHDFKIAHRGHEPERNAGFIRQQVCRGEGLPTKVGVPKRRFMERQSRTRFDNS